MLTGRLGKSLACGTNLKVFVFRKGGDHPECQDIFCRSDSPDASVRRLETGAEHQYQDTTLGKDGTSITALETYAPSPSQDRP